jgi:hypothetical protein
MLLSPPTKVVVVLAASLFLAAPGRAEVPCIDVTGCSEYYYALGLIIYEVAIGPLLARLFALSMDPFKHVHARSALRETALCLYTCSCCRRMKRAVTRLSHHLTSPHAHA